MFAAKIIGTFFVASLFLLHIRNYFSDRSDKITRFILSLELITYLYLLFAGIYLLFGWVDPFSGVDLSENSRAVAQGRGRGGLVILIIKFWPYVLIFLSLYQLFYLNKNGWLRFLFDK